jgi:hypothetical protein
MREISGPAVRSIPSEYIYYLIQQTGLATNTSRGLRYHRPRMIDPWLLLKSISAGIAVAAAVGPMSLLCMQRTLGGGPD